MIEKTFPAPDYNGSMQHTIAVLIQEMVKEHKSPQEVTIPVTGKTYMFLGKEYAVTPHVGAQYHIAPLGKIYIEKMTPIYIAAILSQNNPGTKSSFSMNSYSRDDIW